MFYTYGFKPINIKQRGVNFNLKKIGGVENEYIRVSNNITNIIKYNDELHRFDNCTNKKHKKSNSTHSDKVLCYYTKINIV